MPTRRLFLTLSPPPRRAPAPRRRRSAVGSLVDVQVVDRGRGDMLPDLARRGATGRRPAGRPLRRALDQSLGRPRVGRPLGRRRQRRQRRDGRGRADRLRAGALGIGRDHRLAQELLRSRGVLFHLLARLLRGAHEPARQRRRDRRRGLSRARADARAAALRSAARGEQPVRQRRGSSGTGAPRRGRRHGRRQGLARCQPGAAGDDGRSAPAARSAGQGADKLGTGHGEREYSPTTQTTFERASAQPSEIVQVRYDSYANLVASGMIGRPRPYDRPQPFPAFVPDPR